MGAKKKILLIIVLIGIGVSSFFVYRYYLLNKTSNLASFIPTDAAVIVYLNTRACWNQMKRDADIKIEQKFWNKSAYFQHVKSISDLGIDLTSDLAYVENKQIQYFICLLSSAGKFSKLVEASQEGLFTPETTFEEFKSVKSIKDSFRLIWSKDLLYMVRPNKLSLAEIIQRLKVKGEENLLLSEKYKDIVMPDEIIWFYIEQSPIKKWPYHQFKGCLRIDSGIQILATQNLKHGLKLIDQQIADPDSLAVFYCGSKHFLNQIIREFSILHIGDADDGVLSLDYNEMEKILILGGREIREKKFLAYAYDDDFNKIEREYIKRDTVKACELYYRYNSDSSWMKMDNSNQTFPDVLAISQFKFNTYLQFNQDVLSSYLPFKFRKFPFHLYYIEKMDGKQMSITFNLQCRDWKKLLRQLAH